MKKYQYLLLILCISACTGESLSPAVTPALTQTETPLIIPSSPTDTPISTPTQSVEIRPYQKKQIILDYYDVGWHTMFDGIIDWSHSSLVLYTDGQLIVSRGGYFQKRLSQHEIDWLLSQIEGFGFFEIETAQYDEENPIYDFGGKYERVYDGIHYCLLTNLEIEKKVCAAEHYFEYLIPQMKELLKFLDEYEPEGLTPYTPDRILLYVEAGRPSYYLEGNLPDTSIPWPDNLPSLETEDYTYIYADYEEAVEIYNLFENKVSTLVFLQDGKEYTVEIAVVLPHEILSQP
jgi:hypothetical protein